MICLQLAACISLRKYWGKYQMTSAILFAWIKVCIWYVFSSFLICYFRIQQTVSNGKHSTVIDPTPHKHWESLTAQRVPTGPICTIHSADPIPKKGSYHQWGSSTDWGKRLESLPDLTRREIDLHIDTVNMRIRPQKDSTRVSKPAIRGAHLLAERYLNSETISTRSGPICCFAQLQRIINVNLL